MRNYLFRGKNRYTGEWHYGDLIQGDRVYIQDFEEEENGIILPSKKHEVDPETVGQWTGLTDKNGAKIFEGDLLRFPIGKSKSDKINYTSYEVFFHDGDHCDYHIGFQIDRTHYHGNICGGYSIPFKPEYTSKMEIEGNIHDNPEMLK
jgi:uncharacterized phage protein (TIGR01671 family)